MLLFISSAHAEFLQNKVNENTVCSSNTTLTTTQTWITSSGNIQTISVNSTCQFGCNDTFNSCRLPQLIEYSLIFTIIMIIILIIAKIVGCV
jgi:hypothetical protein